MSRVRWALGLLLVLLTATTVADEGSDHSAHASDVERILELIGAPSQVNAAAAQVVELYSARLDTQSLTQDEQAIVDAYHNDLRKLVSTAMTWEAMKPNYIRVYGEHLDHDGVIKILEFLESDSGKSFIASQSAASAELSALTAHIFEADVSGPLNELAETFRSGLQQLRSQNQLAE